VEIKGKLITMAEVEDIIYAHPESRPLPIQLIREKRQPQDKLRLRLCYNAQIVKEPEQYRLKVAHELKEEFGVDVEVLLITPGEVGRRYHKFERVVGADGKGKIWPFAGWL
jgi:phenylacetate-coenzyme A ligase PaaK-like adenylate-forming protein